MQKTKILIILLCAIMAVNTLQSAYAQSVIQSTNNSKFTDFAAVTSDGRYWIQSGQDGGNIKAYSTGYTLLGTITCTNNWCNTPIYYHTDTGRLYYIDGTTMTGLKEIDATGYFNSRTLSLGATHTTIFRYNSTFIMTATTLALDRVNLNAFTKTAGSSFTAQCSSSIQLLYADTANTNKAVFSCRSGTTLQLAFMSNVATAFTAGAFDGKTTISGTADQDIGQGVLDYTNNVFYYVKTPAGTSPTINKITWNGTAWTNDTVIYDSGGQKLSLYVYNDSVNSRMYVVSQSRTLIVVNTSTGAVTNYSFASSVSGSQQASILATPFTYSSGTKIVIPTDTTYWIDFSLSGTIPSSNTGGIDCTQSSNANILICRIVSQTGGNVGGASGIINHGVFTLMVNAGVISGSDTNPKTNGIGYFVTIVGFGIMVAIFWIASKGRLEDIPTFIWFISSLALLGALTAIQWLDPTFLIIGIIAIIALAVAKLNKTLFSGASFGGGDF